VLRLGPADEPHLLAARTPHGAEAFIPTLGMAEMPQLARHLDDPVCAARVDNELASELIRAGFGPSLSFTELAVLQAKEIGDVVLEPAP
jgi:hypothetical protein